MFETLLSHLLGTHPEVELQNHMVNSMFTLLRDHHTVLLNGTLTCRDRVLRKLCTAVLPLTPERCLQGIYSFA